MELLCWRNSIQKVSEYALTNREEFIQKVRSASVIQQQEAAKELQRQIRKAEKRHKELDTLIEKLYESYALEKIPERRFETLSATYEQEQADLEASIAKGKAELAAYEEDTSRVEEFMALARKYTDFTELTTPMLLEFVDKVLVHKADYSSGERVVAVDVYLRFIGNFAIPMPELTPEEKAGQERLRERREKSRLRHKRYRDRKRQEELAARAEKELNGRES